MICLVGAFAGAEVLLRVARSLFADPRAIQVDAEVRDIVGRVHHIWFSGDGSDPFVPPFKVFSNKGSDDQVRLGRIFSETLLPPSRTWESYDFLQDEKKRDATAYTITSNSLGFRSSEYSKEKDDAFRVIVLGSYQAFGHGVDDAETYPAVLEKALNEKYPKKHIEVWNGGRHAGTAIIGLARMTYEIFDYDPDLIVLDYGFMDSLVVGDDVFPQAMHFPRAIRFIVRPLVYLFDHSVLFAGMWNTFYGERDTSAARSDFTDVMSKMVALARSHDVPVLVVRQLNATPRADYTAFTGSTTPLVDVDSVFADAAFVPPKPEEWHDPYYSSTWLSELDPETVEFARTLFRHYGLRLNLYQLNSRGQDMLGRAIADTIEKWGIIPKQ